MRLMLLIAGLTGCGALELEVTFDIPDEYLPLVERVELRVIVPPAGDPFSCDDLAFSSVATKTVTQSTIATYTLDGRTSLGELDRRSQKLFFAQAIGDDSLPVVSGCTEVGVLEASTSITIDGEPAPIGGLGIPPDGFRQTFQGLDVICRNVLGASLPGIPFRWVVLGASPDANPILDGGEGTTVGTVTELALPEPQYAGPATLTLAVRWQRNLNEPLSILAGSEPWVGEFTHARAHSLAVGQFGAATIATLSTNTASVMWIHQYVYDPGATAPGFPFVAPPPTAVPATSGALLAVERNGVDALVMIANEPAGSVGWVDFLPVNRRELSPASIAVVAAALPACDASANVLVRFLDANLTRVYDLAGTQVPHPFEHFPNVDAVMATGCLPHEGNRLQAIALNDGPMNLLAVATDQAYVSMLSPGVAPVGFSPPDTAELAFVPEASADSQLLARFEALALVDEGPNNTLVLGRVGEDTLGGTPIALATGDLDADGNTDVAALIVARAPSDAGIGTKLVIILGKEVRLTAWSRSLDGFVSPAMAMGDVDNNGFDDVVLAETEPGRDGRIVIYPMGPL